MATTEAQRTTPDQPPSAEGASGSRMDLRSIPGAPWLAGLAAVLIVLIVSLVVWGPEMDYPTTVSTSQVATSDGGSVEITRTVRDVTGDAIDDAVVGLIEQGPDYSTD